MESPWTRGQRKYMNDRRVASIVVIYEDGRRDAFSDIGGVFRKRVNWTGDKGRDCREYDEYEVHWSSPLREVTRASE
jgi:hypothetical protein